MRQAGILAAAGIVALDQMVDRLAEDHRRAKILAGGLALIPGLKIETPVPATNMVFVQLSDQVSETSQQIAARLLAEYKVKVGTVGPRRFRMVTHYWIDDEGVERTIQALRKVL